MTEPTDLDAIRGRADAATPGPWEWRGTPPGTRVKQILVTAGEWKPYAGTVLRLHGEDLLAADAAFIAGARTDVPALLAAVEQMRDLLGSLVDADDCWFDHHGGCQAHGFLSLESGERCPHAEAKELLAQQGAR